MAVIRFPKVHPDRYASPEGRIISINTHLRKWGDKAFPNPFERDSPIAAQAVELETLLRWLWLYIKDYLSKATSQCLPLAYLELPSFSSEDLLNSDAQITLSLDSQSSGSFHLHLLTKDEQRRILGAFLRYELLCKIYAPLGGASNRVWVGSFRKKDGLDRTRRELGGYMYNPGDPFRYWDWRVLCRYEEQEMRDLDRQLLPCVREYLLTVYGPFIADQVKAPIPQGWRASGVRECPSTRHRRFPRLQFDCVSMEGAV